MRTYDLFKEKSIHDNDVKFDTENYGPIDLGNPAPYARALYGVHVVDEQIYYLVYAGGDWEYPVTICFYYDNNAKLHRYIPEEGNVFNKDTREAFGNGDQGYDWEQNPPVELPDLDIEYIKKAYPNHECCKVQHFEDCDDLISTIRDEAAIIADVERHLRSLDNTNTVNKMSFL